MKKFFLFFTAVFIAAMFIGCKNPTNDTPNNNTPNSDTPTSNNPTGESPSTTPPTTQTTEDGLPVNVGVDPFKGNTYEVSSNKLYVFKNDGTYEETYRDDGSLRCIIKYTYNANTKVLARKYYKLPNDEFSFRTATNYDLWTLDECISYLNGLSDEQLASIHRTRRDITEAIELIRNYFEEINYVKAEQETYNGNLCLSIREYYTEEESRSLILSEIPHEFTFRTTSNDLWANIGNPAEAHDYIEIGGSALTQNYRITQVTDSTITAIGQNDNVILTLNYTKSWADGVIYLTISGADDVSKSILGNQTFGLSTSTSKKYHPKLTTNNVGTDPFRGNTYQTGDAKYLFGTDGTFSLYAHSGQNWMPFERCDYTYNANTKILSIIRKQYVSTDMSSIWTLQEWTSYLQTASEAEINRFGVGEMTRAQMLEIITNYFSIPAYLKAEEVMHEGNLCLSCRSYYPADTTCRIDSFIIENGCLSVRTSVLKGTDVVYSGGVVVHHSSALSTNYSMTNITNSTITATSEDGNSTITLNYTISWEDGMYTLIITGADNASQSAIGGDPITTDTKDYHDGYFPKVTQ